MSASVLALSEVNGKRFGRLTALAFSGYRRRQGQKAKRWEFVCDCGRIVDLLLYQVRCGLVRSCGCLSAEQERALFQSADVGQFVGRHGIYENASVADRVGLIETAFSSQVINRTLTPIDEWFYFEPDYWSRRQVRVIEHARDLWRDIGRPTHPHFDWKKAKGDGLTAERAKNLLRRAKHFVGNDDWNVFENVIRWNEPTGRRGSHLCKYRMTEVAAAKNTVRGVAQALGEALVL